MLTIATIVEGHGEIEAVPLLVRRIWFDYLGMTGLRILPPIRRPRSKLLKDDEFLRALELARSKLDQEELGCQKLVLVLFDADEIPSCRLAPGRLALAIEAHDDLDIAVVLPDPEFETWFAGSAASILSPNAPDVGENVDRARMGKKWIEDRLKRYSPTVDQPRLTARIDIGKCRKLSPSFDKLCRELEKRATV